jgi:single-stranded DNA-specific DHH superfamily exonuclease
MNKSKSISDIKKVRRANHKKLWIFGECDTDGIESISFGIFDEKKKAIRHCKTEDHFIVPIHLNEVVELEEGRWGNCGYYPILTKS